MTRFTDAFDRTSTSIGANYTLVTSATTGTYFEVNGQVARTRVTAATAALLIAGQGPSTADQFAAVTLPSNTGASTAVGVRLSNPSGAIITGYVLRLTASAFALQRLNADGTATSLSGEQSRTRAAGDRIAVTAVGSTITAYINGVQVAQFTDTALTTGRPGIRNSGTTDVTYDDFDAGDVPTDAAGVNGLPSTAPTSAPGQVTGLTLGTPTSSTIPASWSAAATASAYVVEFRASGASQWTALPAVTTTSATITGLAASTVYEVRVTASNSVGSGAPSATASATTPAPSANPPGQTTGLTAGTATTTTVPLTWTATADATAYIVEFQVTGATEWSSLAAVAESSATVPSLAPGTGYTFRVTPRNAAGLGTPSATVSKTTLSDATAIVTSENQARSAFGFPAWRGLIYNPAGERIGPGDVLHRMDADFYGPAGTWTPPSWLTVPDGTPALSSSLGCVLKLTTAAAIDAKATLQMAVPLTTTAVRGVLIELRHQAFSAASPAADYRLYAANGNAGASAVHLRGGDTCFLASQGENNRTITAQEQIGEDAARRRHVGLLVSFATKEAWLMEDGNIIGYRDCASTWTDGTVNVGVSATAKTTTAVELRLASLAVTVYG